MLDKEEIPAIKNVPRVIAAAHKVCRKLDGGVPVNDILDGLTNDAYNIDPTMRLYPARLTTTMTRFITAAVEIYCTYDQSKIASIKANPEPVSNDRRTEPPGTRSTVNSGSDLRERPPGLDLTNVPAAWQEPTGTATVRLPHLMDGGVFVAGRYGSDRSDGHGKMLASLMRAVPAGDPRLPDPPQIPAPPPPNAHILTPAPPIAVPAPPKQSPPPPQQPPLPQEVEPPADAPQPGGPAGGGGSGGSGGNGIGEGGNGGGGPVEPSPARPMPPGFIRLAP